MEGELEQSPTYSIAASLSTRASH